MTAEELEVLRLARRAECEAAARLVARSLRMQPSLKPGAEKVVVASPEVLEEERVGRALKWFDWRWAECVANELSLP